MKPIRHIITLVALILVSQINAQTFIDNLADEIIGNAPTKWNVIEGTATIGTQDGEKVIILDNEAIISPLVDFDNSQSEEFTLSFDAYFDDVEKSMSYQNYKVRFWEGKGNHRIANGRITPLTLFRNGMYMHISYPTNAGNKNEQYKEGKLDLEGRSGEWRNIIINYNAGTLKVTIDNIQIVEIPNIRLTPSMISIQGEYLQASKDYIRAIKNVKINNLKEIPIDNEGDGELITVLSNPNGNLLNFDLETVIDNIVNEEMIRQNLPGLSIGVYKKGVIDYTKGYGFIDLNRKKPITDNTVMRWASISKTITAIATLRLAEQMRTFDIDDKVVDHYPYWTSPFTILSMSKPVLDKDLKNKITIRNLLNNRSGIAHYGTNVSGNSDNYNDINSQQFNANSAVDIFRFNALESDPDKKYIYTTQGFNLLGAVIDKKYSNGYVKYVEKTIKDKLGMTSLKVSNGNFSGFQRKTDGVINELVIGSKEWVLPGGGWESNVKDLLKYAKGIIDEKLLIKTDELWKDDGYSQTYKRGIESGKVGNVLWISHGGAHGNLRTLMSIMPNNDAAIVIMIPAQYAVTTDIANKILKTLRLNISWSEANINKCRSRSGMGSSDKKFIGVWRKTDNEVIIRRGLYKDNFYDEWKHLSSKGYYLTDFEENKQDLRTTQWDGIFKKGNGQYAMWRNFTYEGFKNKWDEMRASGYVLYDIETYLTNGRRLWAGLFEKKLGRNKIVRDMNTKDFGDLRNQIKDSGGYQLIDIEHYTSEGEKKWAGVWIDGSKELLYRNQSYDQFKTLTRSNNSDGYKLIDVETYLLNGAKKWAGIWVKSDEAQQYSLQRNYCDTMNRHENYVDQGYELIELESY